MQILLCLSNLKILISKLYRPFPPASLPFLRPSRRRPLLTAPPTLYLIRSASIVSNLAQRSCDWRFQLLRIVVLFLKMTAHVSCNDKQVGAIIQCKFHVPSKSTDENTAKCFLRLLHSGCLTNLIKIMKLWETCFQW